jgi:hypothetical protein
VVDYQRLNSVIKPLQTPLNVPQDIFDKLSKYSCFTGIDLKDAFNSIMLTEKAQKACSVITPFGVFSP